MSTRLGRDQLIPLVTKVAKERGVDPALLYGITMVESGGDYKAIGDKNRADGDYAAGLTQIRSGALADINKRLGTKYTKEDLTNNPELALTAGAVYLLDRQEMFGPSLGIQRYNGSGEAAERYANKVLGAAKGYNPSFDDSIYRGRGSGGRPSQISSNDLYRMLNPETEEPSFIDKFFGWNANAADQPSLESFNPLDSNNPIANTQRKLAESTYSADELARDFSKWKAGTAPTDDKFKPDEMILSKPSEIERYSLRRASSKEEQIPVVGDAKVSPTDDKFKPDEMILSKPSEIERYLLRRIQTEKEQEPAIKNTIPEKVSPNVNAVTAPQGVEKPASTGIPTGVAVSPNATAPVVPVASNTTNATAPVAPVDSSVAKPPAPDTEAIQGKLKGDLEKIRLEEEQKSVIGDVYNFLTEHPIDVFTDSPAAKEKLGFIAEKLSSVYLLDQDTAARIKQGQLSIADMTEILGATVPPLAAVFKGKRAVQAIGNAYSTFKKGGVEAVGKSIKRKWDELWSPNSLKELEHIDDTNAPPSIKALSDRVDDSLLSKDAIGNRPTILQNKDGIARLDTKISSYKGKNFAAEKAKLDNDIATATQKKAEAASKNDTAAEAKADADIVMLENKKNEVNNDELDLELFNDLRKDLVARNAKLGALEQRSKLAIRTEERFIAKELKQKQADHKKTYGNDPTSDDITAYTAEAQQKFNANSKTLLREAAKDAGIHLTDSAKKNFVSKAAGAVDRNKGKAIVAGTGAFLVGEQVFGDQGEKEAEKLNQEQSDIAKNKDEYILYNNMNATAEKIKAEKARQSTASTPDSSTSPTTAQASATAPVAANGTPATTAQAQASATTPVTGSGATTAASTAATNVDFSKFFNEKDEIIDKEGLLAALDSNMNPADMINSQLLAFNKEMEKEKASRDEMDYNNDLQNLNLALQSKSDNGKSGIKPSKTPSIVADILGDSVDAKGNIIPSPRATIAKAKLQSNPEYMLLSRNIETVSKEAKSLEPLFNDFNSLKTSNPSAMVSELASFAAIKAGKEGDDNSGFWQRIIDDTADTSDLVENIRNAFSKDKGFSAVAVNFGGSESVLNSPTFYKLVLNYTQDQTLLDNKGYSIDTDTKNLIITQLASIANQAAQYSSKALDLQQLVLKKNQMDQVSGGIAKVQDVLERARIYNPN